MSIEQIKNLAKNVLESSNNEFMGARIFNGLIAFLIIFSIVVIPLHFMPQEKWLTDLIRIFDKFTISIFTVEYLLRIWISPKPFKYIFSRWGFIDIVALLPFYLAKMHFLAHPELFFLLRILRIFKLARIHELGKEDETKRQHANFSCIKGEIIERIVHKHFFIFLVGMVLPFFFMIFGVSAIAFFQLHLYSIIFGILFLILGGVFFLKIWIDYAYDVIYITNKRIVLQNRELFGMTQNDVAYTAIANAVPRSTGFFRWMFRFGDVDIETAAATGNFVFEDAPEPQKVVQHIIQNRHIALEKIADHPPQSMPVAAAIESGIDAAIQSDLKSETETG